jgi:regulator of cell morphogenesis and NO signaling
MGHKYRSTDRMSTLISDDYTQLQVLSRFGISLGFGDKTVGEVCAESHVDCETFLAVCNFIGSGIKPSFDEYSTLSVPAMLNYLRLSHAYFLEFMLPSIRQKLVSAVDCSSRNEVAFLILQFFDEYAGEVQRHMEYENANIFAYVEGLLTGRRSPGFSLNQYENEFSHASHKSMDTKFSDLKNIIIRYCPPAQNNNLLNAALQDLFSFEEDLTSHCQVEDTLFIPMVSLLESSVEIAEESNDDESPENNAAKEPLSQRERDILLGVVKGMTNKEMADNLCISIHTVLTHRRNIARKLEIHSPAGLVIYAIVNGIVKVEDIKDLNYS